MICKYPYPKIDPYDWFCGPGSQMQAIFQLRSTNWIAYIQTTYLLDQCAFCNYSEMVYITNNR